LRSEEVTIIHDGSKICTYATRKGTYHACAGSTKSFASRQSPRARRAAEHSATEGPGMSMAAVSDHFFNISAGMGAVVACEEKFADFGVM
jgi:hypothetical protein